MKYEYYTVDINLAHSQYNKADHKLNQLTKEGWRVNQALSFKGTHTTILMERKVIQSKWYQLSKRTKLIIYWTIVVLGLLPFAMVLIGKVLSK